MPRTLETTVPSVPEGWRQTLAIVVPALLLLFVYAASLGNGFVLDDDLLITDNANVTRPGGLFRTWFTTGQLDYWPITYTSFWLEWKAFGADATGYHAVSLGLHFVSVLLLWRILVRLGVPGAWLASVVFAVHPVNVESVAWAVQRKNTLSMLFFLLTLLTYLRFDDTGRRRTYFLSLALFACALLSKTSVVMLPLLLLLFAWWRHGRIRVVDVKRASPFFALSLALGLVTIWFQNHRVIGESLARSDGFASRLAGAGQAVWFYLGKALLPLQQELVYPRWKLDPSEPAQWVPLALLLASFAVLYRFRSGWGRPGLFALSFFVVALLPVLGFLDIHFMKMSLVADHWQYYAIPSIIALVVGSATWFIERQGLPIRRAATALAIVVVGLLSVAARTHTKDFKDKETFFSKAMTGNPDSILIRFLFADELDQQGRPTEGAAVADAALAAVERQIREGRVEAHEHAFFATVFRARGRPAEAKRELEEAIRLSPGSAKPYFDLAGMEEADGNKAEALRLLHVAVTASPGYEAAHMAVARLSFDLGQTADARRSLEEAVRINPQNTTAHGLLGDVLADAGDVDGAASHYRSVLELNPTHRIAREKLQALEARGARPGP